MPLQLWVSVVELGTFFGLMGLAYLVILRGAGFFNFALGPLAAFAAMTTSHISIIKEQPLVVGLAAGLLAAVLLSVLTEILVVRPIEARTDGAELPALVAVVAVLFAVGQLAAYLYGHMVLPGRVWVPGPALTFGSVIVPRQSVVLVVSAVIVFVAVSWWMRSSRYGRLLRAVGDNKAAAQVLGLPVRNVRIVAFAVAGLVVGLAGPLFAPKAGIGFDSGLHFSLFGFLALVIGGTGRTWAPLVGGLILGAVQVFVSYVFGGAALDYVTLLLALLFFAARPQGLFAQRVRT